MLVENRDRLPNRIAIGHPTNLEVAEYSQRVMTDEVQKVEVDEIIRQILLSHCHAVKIDRATLLHVADVPEGDRLPEGVRLTGGSGPARVRGHVKSLYSAGEMLKAPVSSES